MLLRSRSSLVSWPLLILLGGLSGCTCGGSKQPLDGPGMVAPPTASSITLADGAVTDAVFSKPIDAVHASDGAVYVAGLVVAHNAIEVAKVRADGSVAWTHTAFEDVRWSVDAELDVRALGTGLVVSWEGPRHKSRGKEPRVAQMIDGDGQLHGEAFGIGGPMCTTRTEVAWPESETAATKVMARGWDGPAREVARVSGGREATIVCSRSAIFATGEGDDDVTVVPPGGKTLTLMADVDFPNDEERDSKMYGVGDMLGVVRVGGSGAVAVREIQGALTPWRMPALKLSEDDDLLAVDGDARATYLVTSHDDEKACNGGGGSTLHALVLARPDGGAGSATAGGDVRDLVLEQPDCDHERGPFWTDQLGDQMVVAWAVRASRADKTTPPIAALTYRTIDANGVRGQASLATPADALVDAGCDAKRCYAVALSRAPGTDVMLPESAKVVTYP